jgi:hypothetical protein
MSLNLELLREWLHVHSEIPWLLGPEDPKGQEMPDMHGVVTGLPGSGLSREGTFYVPAFQLTIRGKQRVFTTPHDKAMEVDRLLLKGDYPHDLWGDRVLSCTWTGGGPAPVQNIDNANRVTYTCTYLLDCAY